MQAVFRETAIAHKQAARPGCFLFDLSMEHVQVIRLRRLALPFGLE